MVHSVRHRENCCFLFVTKEKEEEEKMFAPTTIEYLEVGKNAHHNQKNLSNIEKCAYVLNSKCFSSLAVHLFFPSDVDDDAQETTDSVCICVCVCERERERARPCVCMKSSGNRGIYIFLSFALRVLYTLRRYNMAGRTADIVAANTMNFRQMKNLKMNMIRRDDHAQPLEISMKLKRT